MEPVNPSEDKQVFAFNIQPVRQNKQSHGQERQNMISFRQILICIKKQYHIGYKSQDIVF